MKKLLTTLLVMLLVLSVVSPAYAEENSVTALSDLSEQECIAFIKAYGVSIPNDYTEEEWAPFVKSVIKTVEANPAHSFSFNYSVTQKFVEDIQQAVWAYYGYTAADFPNQASARSNYTLQHSVKLYDEWNNNFKNYNCYAYALYGTSATRKLYIGKPSNDSPASSSLSLDTLTEIVIDDLAALNKCVVGYSCELSYAPVGNNLICLRKGYNPDSGLAVDYHFMKYSSNNWYHKPGESMPLRYRHEPDSSIDWINEGVNSSGPYLDATVIYSGTINYIVYNNSHGSGTGGTFTGEHYHSGTNHYYKFIGTCAVCGHGTVTYYDIIPCSGPPCILPASVNDQTNTEMFNADE